MRHAERYEQIGLSFVAGYADTLSFIALSGLFTAHVTGDVILAAAQTTGGGSGRAVSNLTMIVIFVIGDLHSCGLYPHAVVEEHAGGRTGAHAVVA